MGKVRIASLFSGCGGMDLGILGGFTFLNEIYARNPIEIVYAVDNDKYACAIYNENFGSHCVHKDIRTVDPAEIPACDVLVGGFPCQSFSVIAQNPPRLGYKHENGRLFFEMCRILKEKKPSCFIAENVKGILSANNEKAFPLIIKNFEEAGYYVKYQVINASHFGVPQKRERVVIVGFTNKEQYAKFTFPEQVVSEKTPLSAVLQNEDDIPSKYYFSEKAINGMQRVKEKMNKGRIQDLSKPCNTIGAHLAKVSINSTDPVLKINNRYRRFTPREAARIQSFPENFTLIGSEGRQYRAVGNAVPPVMMWYVIKQVLAVLAFEEKVNLDFKNSQSVASLERSYYAIPEEQAQM